MTIPMSGVSRKISFSLLTVGAVLCVSIAWAQGPAQRIGQGLDNAGKNIRRGVEGAVVRGQVSAFERDLLGRVYHRIHWDNLLINSGLELIVQVDGTVILRGAVSDVAAKNRAVDLAKTTVGVTSVVDELVVGKTVITVPATTTTKSVIVVPENAPVTEAAPTIIIKP